MNKSTFRLAFMAVLASSLSGCASPMKMFAKKPQTFDEFRAQRAADQTRIAGSHSTPGGAAEVSELLHQGHAAYQQGNLADAHSKYAAVVQRQSNHPVANHRLGVIADRQQDYLTAQRHYFAALNVSPNDPNLLNDIGYSFLLQSRYAEAESYFQGALQKNSKQSNAINNLGLLYARQGQPDRALAMFRMTNSDAEAQSKVARLMPAGLPAAPPVGSMLANQGGLPPNAAAMNPAPFLQQPFNVTPNYPAIDRNNGQPLGNTAINGLAGSQPLPMQPPNNPNSGWVPPDLTPPNNSQSIAQMGAVIDPSLPEATRRLKEQMEINRQKAIADRQIRDNFERQRQEQLKRQLREDEFGQGRVVNPGYAPPNFASAWNGPPASAPGNSNAPIVIGPPPNPAVPDPSRWQPQLDGQRLPTGEAGTAGNGQFQTMPTLSPNPRSNTMPNLQADPRLEPMPNAAPWTQPPSSSGSPLDTMPSWPPNGALPTHTPNSSFNGPSFLNSTPNSTAWPNGTPNSAADDAARAASRLGMNAGPSNPFPITPGPSSGTTNTPNWSNAPNTLNNSGGPNGAVPATMPNWQASPNSQEPRQQPNEPPPGTFGSNSFNNSDITQAQFLASPGQRTSQDQLPPSEQYQTPGRFGYLPPGSIPAQPASFGTSRNSGSLPAQQFRVQNYSTAGSNQSLNSAESNGSRGASGGRSDGDERWDVGSVPETQSVQSSTPSMQGHLATPYGDNSLLEYERMIQTHNAEANRIRQQIDEHRQLPVSENFRRSRSQPQSGAPSDSGPRQ